MRFIFLRFVFRVFLRCGKSRKGKRGASIQKCRENDHGSVPLLILGQMSAAGCTHDPRFLSRQAERQERSFNEYKRAFRAEGRTSIKL